MNEYLEQVVASLKRAPGFETIAVDDCKLTRLGGLTNLVHLVEVGDDKIIVRIAGDGTDEYIDRSIEAVNAQAAYEAGVSAEVLFCDPSDGLMVSRAIENVETMTPKLFRSRTGSPLRAGAALARLHNSNVTFDFRFELFSMIDEYLELLSTKDVKLPDGYHEIVKAAEPIKAVLEEKPSPLAPCHCDPLCENFLDDGDVMWVIDWEYSGMNDPLWDVGDLSVEAGMDEAQELELMTAYFCAPPTPAQHGRIVIYKAMCDLLWTLWGLIQYSDDNPAEDFWAYATGRFDRCKALMNDPSFERHLTAVRNG